MKILLILFLLAFPLKRGHAEVIKVDKNSSTYFVSYVPTQTLYLKAVNPKALIILVPGGSGNLGLKKDTVEINNFFYHALKSLTDEAQSFGQFDLVLIDFPNPLSQRDLSSRATEEHMVRIDRVIKFYRHKTNLPIWLMGHSNGGVSLGNFIRYLQRNKRSGQINGMIASGIRNESSFKFTERVDFPVLFIHHEKDECPNAKSDYALANYDLLKGLSKAKVHFKWISSGEAELSDPCQSGFHMYYNSGFELPNVIKEFITN